MDISRGEQRILHLLALGGRIIVEKDEDGRPLKFECFTRNGWIFPGLNPKLFRKLKRRRCIASSKSGPYQITRRGLQLVRARPDNR